VNIESWRGRAAIAAPAGEPRDRLGVKDVEGLHVLGRFFQAMLLNLLKDPLKVRDLERMDMVVAIDPPTHPGSALTLFFSGGQVVLANGISSRPDIVLKCEAAVMMKLARMPAGPAAVRFLRTHEGRYLIARMRSGELKIRGVARHPLGMKRFAEFLAPSSG
jgi:hypothetical protein